MDTTHICLYCTVNPAPEHGSAARCAPCNECTIVRVDLPNSGAARGFWLYNRRFDGRPADPMFGFEMGTALH